MGSPSAAFGFLADAIGITTGSASIFSALVNSDTNPAAKTNMNILTIAMGYNYSANMDVTCWDQYGSIIANEGAYVGSANTVQVTLQDCNVDGCDGDSVGKPATNCTIFPSYDNGCGDFPANAACVSGLTLTTSAGQAFSWMGDTWASCGWPAYPGGRVFATNGSNGNGQGYSPMCALIDNTKFPAAGQEGYEALSVNFPKFTSNAGSSPPPNASLCDISATQAINVPNGNTNYLSDHTTCNTDPVPPYRRDGGRLHAKDMSFEDWASEVSIEDESGGSPWNPLAADSPGKQLLRERAATGGPYQNKNETRLVMSTLKGNPNSAKNLCSMKNSWGPDFINVIEGYYCDMSTRTLLTMCPPPNSMKCMDNCWRWDGQLTLTKYTGGKITEVLKKYGSMVRHPSPLVASDPSLPGACGTY